MFERLQASLIEQDRAVMWRVVDNAVARRPLAARPSATASKSKSRRRRCACAISCAKRKSTASRSHAGILSPQTWSQHLGLDYDQEQKNLAVHKCIRA